MSSGDGHTQSGLRVIGKPPVMLILVLVLVLMSQVLVLVLVLACPVLVNVTASRWPAYACSDLQRMPITRIVAIRLKRSVTKTAEDINIVHSGNKHTQLTQFAQST